MTTDAVRAARALAESLLLPDADVVDRASRVPESHLRALDDAGLTGLAASSPSLPERFDVSAALAGGCLSTAFVWLQHQGALGAVAVAGERVRKRWLAPLRSGSTRAGVVVSAVVGPRPLSARRTEAGFVVSGPVPWVTGWGLIDVVLVAAVDEDRTVHLLLADASPAPTLRVRPLHLVAAGASETAALELDEHLVPADRLIGSQPLDDRLARDAAGLAGNGALALGVAARALEVAGPGALDDELRATRNRLLTASPNHLPAARAAASELAVRAAGLAVLAEGASAALQGSEAARLTREAQFLLVFGSRAPIRADLQRRLGAPRP